MNIVQASAGSYTAQPVLNALTRPETKQLPMTLDAFLSSIERRAYRMANLATHSNADALDIVQEAMMKLVQKYRHRDHSEWPMLFQTILQNKILDWHRQQTRQRRLFFWQDSANKDEEDETAEQTYADPTDTNPAHLLAQTNDIETVLAALENLPIRQQQAFLLRAWEGYDVNDTAKIMRCSSGSVKTHYFRALNKIRDLLENSHAPA